MSWERGAEAEERNIASMTPKPAWPKCNRSACKGRVDPNTLRCNTCGDSVVQVDETEPKPSIKVGDQVRLTGVVEHIHDGDWINVRIAGDDSLPYTTVNAKAIEVIRQPFKRGEVVWNRYDDSEPEPFVVVNDESEGVVDVVNCRTGAFSEADNPRAYERRRVT